ncbi:TonB-dependent receptor [candidate division KSB1 bacterium]|nr:MAG: TonB-dependent receptor [candidate division KSB1 bacterium]MCE7941541.1 TonB-dependent receptor [Chlorobi bacterium CHB1]MDL1876721.1 TonB-dependent receptor [Cytophagia bacterium CHB2]
MRKLVLCSFSLLSLWCAGEYVYAQNTAQPQGRTKVIFTGKVIDRQLKRPLPGAQVYFPDLRRGTVTDEDGQFEIKDIQAGQHKIICRLLGYATVTETLTFSQDLNYEFRLAVTPLEEQEVTVTADANDHSSLTGSSQSVAVLRAAELEKARGQSLGETLKDIPGVTVMQTGPSIAKPVVRGLHSDRILVLNAGVAQEGQQWGGEHAPEIDPFAPARIEVLKGAAGVQYGSNAIGGVIRIEPRALRDTPGFGGQVWLNGFSNNLQGSGSLLLEGAMKKIPGFAWRLQGSLRKAGDAQTPDYNMRNSGFFERDAALGFGYQSTRFSTELNLSHFSTELGIFSGAHIGNTTDLLRAIERGRPLTKTDFSYDLRPPKQDIVHNLLSLKSQIQFARLGRLEVQYGWQQNHRQEFDAHKPYNDSLAARARPSFDLTLTTHSVELAFSHQPAHNFFGRLGVSGVRQGNVQQGTILLIPNFRAYSGGVYALETWARGRWTINFGGRFEAREMKVYRISQQRIVVTNHRYNNLTGVLGALYQLGPSWSLGMNLGTAWRPPGINELYSNGVHHGTAQFEIGDLNLKSERSLQADLTLKHDGERSRAELSLYNNRMRDLIFLMPQPEPTLTIRGAFPTFRYRQADAVIRGFDGFVHHQFTDFFELGVSAAIVYGQNLEASEPLIQMPADRFRLFTHWRLPKLRGITNAHLDLGGTFVRRQTRVPANADYAKPPAPYALVDASLGFQFDLAAQPVIFDASVQNVLNTRYRDYLSRYRYFIDDPGRSFILRLQIPFGKFEQE